MERKEIDQAIKHLYGKGTIALPDDRYLERKGQEYLNNQGWLERELGNKKGEIEMKPKALFADSVAVL